MTQENYRPRCEALLVKAPEAAAMLGIGIRTLQTLTAKGELPKIKFGRSVRWAVPDLREWIEANRFRGEERT